MSNNNKMDIIIADGATKICEKAFVNCDWLTSIVIPNSVKSIGDRAFAWCSSLTSVTIGNGVTSIGDWAFAYCSRLDVYYGDTLERWKVIYKDINWAYAVPSSCKVYCTDGVLDINR